MSGSLYSRYLQILEVQASATEQELKKAYRRKALQLHPDRNKSPRAHEEFVELTEAYEYLLNYDKGGSAAQVIYREQQWRDTEKQKARERARQHAQMKHEEFINSHFYKSVTSLESVVKHVFIMLFLLAFIGFLISSFISGNIEVMIGAIILAAGGTLLLKLFGIGPNLNLEEFIESLKYMAKSMQFILAGIMAFNAIVLLNIGFQTLVPLLYLLALYVLGIATDYALFGLLGKRKDFGLHFRALAFIPTVISSLLCVNYFFSNNAHTETYLMVKHYTGTRRSVQAYISLPQNKYGEYYGMRVFLDYTPIANNNSITFTFKDGLLGLRVVTAYRFH